MSKFEENEDNPRLQKFVQGSKTNLFVIGISRLRLIFLYLRIVSDLRNPILGLLWITTLKALKVFQGLHPEASFTL